MSGINIFTIRIILNIVLTCDIDASFDLSLVMYYILNGEELSYKPNRNVVLVSPSRLFGHASNLFFFLWEFFFYSIWKKSNSVTKRYLESITFLVFLK